MLYQAIGNGASGFLLMEATPEQLVAAIRIVAAGDSLMAPPAPGASSSNTHPRPSQPRREMADFTARELEIRRLVARVA